MGTAAKVSLQFHGGQMWSTQRRTSICLGADGRAGADAIRTGVPPTSLSTDTRTAAGGDATTSVLKQRARLRRFRQRRSSDLRAAGDRQGTKEAVNRQMMEIARSHFIRGARRSMPPLKARPRHHTISVW